MINFKQQNMFSEYGNANLHAFEKELQRQTFGTKLTQLNVYTNSRVTSNQLVELPTSKRAEMLDKYTVRTYSEQNKYYVNFVVIDRPTEKNSISS